MFRPRQTVSELDAQTITLPDGRTLGYAEYGNSDGTPLLYFHGFPTSRLEASGLHAMVSKHGIRLLAIDRPGFGLSTHDPRRHIMDWPTDVEALTTQLGLARFAVLGVSGGGPYALACARRFPKEKLAATGVFAGAPVWDRGLRTRGIPWYGRLIYLLGNYWPWGLRIISAGLVGAARWILTRPAVEKRIDTWLETLKSAREKEKEKDTDGDTTQEKRPLMQEIDADGEKSQEPELTTAQRRERLMGLIFEGFRQGPAGFVHETQLLTNDWGFKCEDITDNKVQIWHGTRDANAPVESLRDIAIRIPQCVLKEFDETHFSIGTHFEEVFKGLVGGESDDSGR